MAPILWRCPPVTRPAQRFCNYVDIIPVFPEIRKSIIMGVACFILPIGYDR